MVAWRLAWQLVLVSLTGNFWPVTGTVNSMIHGKRVVVDLPAFKAANMLLCIIG